MQTAVAGEGSQAVRQASMMRRCLIWGACLAALCLLVSGHAMSDPDSTLYESIALSLESRPVTQWVAPLWPKARAGEGLFFEHLACFFWPAAALGKLGLRGAMAANFLWVLLSCALLFRLGRALAGKEAAWAAVAFYVISPIGILYLVRANHEPALSCAYLAALWCLADDRGRPALLAVATLLAVMIKGALGLLVFPVALVAWWSGRRRRADLAGLLLGAALVAGFGLFYELWFRKIAGGPFFSVYLGRQLASVLDEERAGFLHLLEAPPYYAGSIAWFGLPGVALVFFDVLQRRRLPISSGRAVLLPAAACAALLSMMARKAVRYAFPAYALCNAAGALVLIERAPRLREWIGARNAWWEAALAAWLVLATALRVAVRFPLSG